VMAGSFLFFVLSFFTMDSFIYAKKRKKLKDANNPLLSNSLLPSHLSYLFHDIHQIIVVGTGSFLPNSLSVTTNCEFIFWEIHGTFLILAVAGLKLQKGKVIRGRVTSFLGFREWRTIYIPFFSFSFVVEWVGKGVCLEGCTQSGASH
jgi:hypothetical protein